jgi:hypothetical protein
MNPTRFAILPIAIALGLVASAQSSDVDATAKPARSAAAAGAPQSNTTSVAATAGQSAEIDLSAQRRDVWLQNTGSAKALTFGWNNGPFVTGTGNGFGGGDTSTLQTGFTTLGYGAQGGTINNRLADDFVVGAGQIVTLDTLVWRAYQTGAATTGTMTGINARLWETAPLTGNLPDQTGPANSMISQVWSGVYRVTSTTLTTNNRAIIDITSDMSWANPLQAGTHWADASMTGSLASGPFCPPTTPAGGSDNSRQFIGSTSTWGAVVDGLSLLPQDFPFVLSGSSFSNAGCTYSNGPFVTGTGNGFGGGDTSTLQTGFTTLGYGAQGGTINNRLADDFAVPSGDTWALQTLVWRAYQTGATTAGTMTGINARLWNSAPLTGNLPDQTGPANSMLSQVWSGVYRVTSTTLTTNNRAIIDITSDMSWATPLAAGTYWADASMTGSLASGPFCPPTTPAGGADNARQFIGSTSTWGAVVDGLSLLPQDFPFELTALCSQNTAEIYCTAKMASCGSTPTIGGPSGITDQGTSGPGSYDVTCGLVDPGSFGIMIYSTDGKLIPPAASIYGTLCLGGTVFRVNPPSTGAVGGPCAATYTFDFGSYLATQTQNPALMPAGLASSGGETVDMQVWYRDILSPGGANLSNAMRFIVLP